MSGQAQSCGRCGLPLSRYNPGDLCQACINAGRKQQSGEQAEIIIDGRKLADLRRKRGMTQKLLADRAGISFSLLEKLERNARRSTSLASLSAIARALNMPLNALLEGLPDAAQADREIIQAAASVARLSSPAAPKVLADRGEDAHARDVVSAIGAALHAVPADHPERSPVSLERDVMHAWELRQSSEYAQLGGLLADLLRETASADSHAESSVHVHNMASSLLKRVGAYEMAPGKPRRQRKSPRSARYS